MPGNATFHPTIETVGFQTAFSVIPYVYKKGGNLLLSIEFMFMPKNQAKNIA
jgi:hypothetical protein